MDNSILAPAAVLVLWSLIMLIWMVSVRMPAIGKLGMDLPTAIPGARGQDIDAIVPPHVAWKSHNYTHLMEQPTLFYAVVAILTLAGEGHGLNTSLAWGYVGLRIIHSLWQALVNQIVVRVSIFVASTLCLLALSINAAIATF